MKVMHIVNVSIDRLLSANSNGVNENKMHFSNCIMTDMQIPLWEHQVKCPEETGQPMWRSAEVATDGYTR